MEKFHISDILFFAILSAMKITMTLVFENNLLFGSIIIIFILNFSSSFQALTSSTSVRSDHEHWHVLCRWFEILNTIWC